MVFSLLGALFYAISNTLIKYVSINFDMYKNMFFQYLFVSIYGFVLIFLFDSFRIDFTGHIPLFLLLGASGFLGIWSLTNGMKHLSSGVVFIIANLYVVLGYFTNSFIFPDKESLSLVKIVLGFIFFIVICILLFEKDEETGIRINKKIYFPIGTAIGWTVYTTTTNYVVKSGIMTPFQGIFYSEFTIILLISILYISISAYKKKLDLLMNKKQFLSNMMIAFFTFIGALGFFIGYSQIPGNYVNIIELLQAPLVVLFSYFFLKDKLTKTETLTIITAFLILFLFLIF